MSTEFAKEVMAQILGKDFQMPTLPSVATQALALAQSEDSTAGQLANLVCKDQSLAANLLRIANSPAYGGSRSIVSLQQAITRLGMQTVAELAVAICVQGSVFPKKAFANLSQQIWRHSLATAMYAKEVARQQRKNVEAAYLCGLLHQIGKPIVLKAVTELCKDKDTKCEEEILALLGELHVPVGLHASEAWKLPSQVFTAIKDSAEYEKAENHRHVAAVVHLSSALASDLLEQEAQNDVADVKELAVLEELSMYPKHLDKIREHDEKIAELVAA